MSAGHNEVFNKFDAGRDDVVIEYLQRYSLHAYTAVSERRLRMINSVVLVTVDRLTWTRTDYTPLNNYDIHNDIKQKQIMH